MQGKIAFKFYFFSIIARTAHLTQHIIFTNTRTFPSSNTTQSDYDASRNI